MILFRILIILCVGSFNFLFGSPNNGDIKKLLKTETYEDYQKLCLIKDKIELLELIEDQLMPLTDNDILDSKMNDLHSYYDGIKEMQKSYKEVRDALEKYSDLKDQDINELYLGSINFLDNQGKILDLVAEAIENNPEAQSLADLAPKMGQLEFMIFKIKSSYQTTKFREVMEKVRDEISSYADALGITEE